MSNQIFKKNVDNDLFFQLLDELCIKNEKFYIFNNDSYKKGVFNQSINNFLESCKPCYHTSKQKYIERKLTYNSFTTILRQICKYNKIIFTSQINLNDLKKYCW